MNRFERTLLHLATFAAAATGAVFLWMKYLLTTDDPYSVVHHPWQPAVLALHVLTVPALVFALGMIAREHVIGRFLEGRPHPSRPSGIAAMLVTVPMIVSGYTLEVLTGAGARKAFAIAHAASGVVFALVYAFHLFLARPGRRGSGRPASDAASRGPGDPAS
ncbi:MAG TPA: hypothetical protein VGA64_13075 [Candidatus Polarisedimenticolia bacterium]